MIDTSIRTWNDDGASYQQNEIIFLFFRGSLPFILFLMSVPFKCVLFIFNPFRLIGKMLPPEKLN